MPLLLFLSYAIALSVALERAGFRSRPAAAPGGATRPQPSRVLIVGATGGTGRRLVAQALERGYMVTALARNPSRLQLNHPHLTVLFGDVLAAASVEAAVHGQDAVVAALGHNKARDAAGSVTAETPEAPGRRRASPARTRRPSCWTS